MNEFIIHGKLPTMNEVISANRQNKYVGAKLKKDAEYMICCDIMRALGLGELKIAENPVAVLIDYYQSNRRTDVDNIQSSTKFILDAMKKCRVIKDDSQRYVRQIYHRIFDSTSKNDYVVVQLIKEDEIAVTFT